MQDVPYSILLEGFEKGKRPLPIKGSFWASIGLNPFIKKGKLTSEYYLANEASSDDADLENLVGADQFARMAISGISSTLILKTGDNFWGESSGIWSSEHTCSLAHTAGHLGAVIDPLNGFLNWSSNQAIGKFDGTVWVDSWLTGLTNTYHYMLSIRNKILVSNGRYIAGYTVGDPGGSDWDTAMLDLQPGYNSKRMRMRKVAGARQVLIQGQYDTDRAKDGIFIWDLVADSPIDFISVPWMYDFFVENNVVYVIHGNKLTLSEVVGTQLRELNSIFDKPVIGTAAQTARTVRFLGKFSDLILISIKATRATAITGDNFYPGLWAYHIKNNALFYWLPPSTENLWSVDVGNIHVTQGDLWVASASEDDADYSYHIDKLTKISATTRTYREMYISPMLDASSIGTKIWKKVKSAHNKLLTTARILFKYRDFSRDLISAQKVISAVSSNTFTFSVAATDAEVGDEVTVIAGTGSGQVRHIIGIDTAYKVFTIDEDWDTNPDTDSWVEIASWKKMSEKSAITNKEADGRILDFNQRGIENQIKLILEHPKDQVIDLKALRVKGEEIIDE